VTRHRPALLLFLSALAGCGGRTTNTVRTEREQDSLLGNSRVPGATAVKRAMTVSDSARSRATQLDSTATEP
jgi:hypothetical protein